MADHPGRRGAGGLAPVVTLVTGAGCAVLAGLQLGGRGVLSAALATALVIAFFWSGLVPLLLARDRQERAGAALVVLLVNYVLRLLLVLVVLRLAALGGVVDARAVGLTVIAGALAWTAAQAVTLIRRGGG